MSYLVWSVFELCLVSDQIGLAGAFLLDVSGRVFLALGRVFRVWLEFGLKIMACVWSMNYCHTLI
jgi:hypothetical protein